MVRSWKLTARNSSGSKLMDSPRRPSVSSAKMSGEQKDDEADRPERAPDPVQPSPALEEGERVDRKSTRLNSSHGYISYAVFCLKKKNSHPKIYRRHRLPDGHSRNRRL